MTTSKLFQYLNQYFCFSNNSFDKKIIKPPLYEEIQQITFDIVIASSVEDNESLWAVYIKLKKLCEANEDTEFNHPFQWDVLDDFTADDAKAIIIYEKALKYAEENKSLEHLSSTYV